MEHLKMVTAAAHPISGARQIRIYRAGLVLASFLFSLVLAEGALRLVEKFGVGDKAGVNQLIKDPVLGLKIAPNTFDHDANGFRNDTVPQHVEIVAVGDSQTWGVNADREGAWPQQLSKISGHSVYNMGLSGSGPVQYHVLTSQALRLSPKLIVVGLYLGNDLYNAYEMAYQNELYRSLRNSNAPDDLRVDTIAPRYEAIRSELLQYNSVFERSAGWGFWLRGHSAIGRLLNRTGWWPGSTDVYYEIHKSWALAHPDHGSVCEERGVQTIFSTASRLMGQDLDEPRIAEGLRITKDLLALMKTEVETRQVKLMVVLIPTKEMVYATTRSETMGHDQNYQKLFRMETRTRSEIIATCREKHIECVDALPDLSRALGRGEQIYPTTTESHPTTRGYSIIAATVGENLAKLSL